MLRRTLLYLSDQQQIYRFIRRNRVARYFASRFVAGETLDEAVAAVRSVNAKGMSASLDLLGESVTSEGEARETGAEYVRILERIRGDNLDCNVSLKLTAMGLDISDALCEGIMVEVLECARRLNIFVRIDMEGSAYTERTLRFFEERLYNRYPEHVGIVLQSYLYRTRRDVERAVEIGCRVRLCKGAYKEPASVAFPNKSDVDDNYLDSARRLLSDANYPGIATHDERMIAGAIRHVTENAIPAERFEFQMLYGVRRDLQEKLIGEGYRLRVYIPFGTQWYPYLMRRLAERPSNIAFILLSILRESFARVVRS